MRGIIVTILVMVGLSVFGQVESNPQLDKQLFKAINDMRQRHGKKVQEWDNYKEACLKAMENYRNAANSIEAPVTYKYAHVDHSKTGQVTQYNLSQLLARLPEALLFEREFSAIAVYTEGNSHYVAISN